MATAPVMPHNDLAFPVGGMQTNPTGTNGGGGTTPAWGANPPHANPQSPVVGPMVPPTGGPGDYGYGASGNPGPTGAPPPTMNPVGSPSTTNPFGNQNTTSTNNEVGKIYGKGVGSEVNAFMDSGGGYNSQLTQQAVQAQTAEMQKQAQTGYGNLESGMGGAGISPNSSVAALESSNYWSNVTTAENAMTAQEYFTMWNDSMNRETSILSQTMGDAAHHKEQQPGLMDWLSMGLGVAGSVIDMNPGGIFGG
jgi:hypothetical protein